MQEVIGSSPTISTKNPRSSERGFFIHCESNGISPDLWSVYHHRRCISSAVGCILFRNDDMQHLRVGDIQNFVLMISTASRDYVSNSFVIKLSIIDYPFNYLKLERPMQVHRSFLLLAAVTATVFLMLRGLVADSAPES